MPAPAHILVIEKQLEVRELLRSALEQDGHRISAAESPTNARHVLAEQRVDAALIEVVLHDGTGLSFADLLRDLGIPVILMSGDVLTIATLAAAPYPYLTKPFRIAQLQNLLNAALGRD